MFAPVISPFTDWFVLTYLMSQRYCVSVTAVLKIMFIVAEILMKKNKGIVSTRIMLCVSQWMYITKK